MGRDEIFLEEEKIKPLTQDQLVAGIKSFLDTVGTAKCNRYINHINKLLPIVIERGGRASEDTIGYCMCIWI